MSGCCLGVPSVSLWRHGDQIPRWDHLGSAASRSSICLAKSWNGITVGGVVKNSPKDTPIELWGSPDSVWLLQSRQSVARSFVHSPSASPKVEREEDPTVRALRRRGRRNNRCLGWTDGRTDADGRRSSGVTDDVITARMREHKEDSARGRDVRWVVQGGKTSAKSFTKQNPGYI